MWSRKPKQREGMDPIWFLVPYKKNSLQVCIKIFSPLSEYTAIHEAKIAPSLVAYVIGTIFMQREKHAVDLLIISSRIYLVMLGEAVRFWALKTGLLTFERREGPASFSFKELGICCVKCDSATGFSLSIYVDSLLVSSHKCPTLIYLSPKVRNLKNWQRR